MLLSRFCYSSSALFSAGFTRITRRRTRTRIGMHLHVLHMQTSCTPHTHASTHLATSTRLYLGGSHMQHRFIYTTDRRRSCYLCLDEVHMLKDTHLTRYGPPPEPGYLATCWSLALHSSIRFSASQSLCHAVFGTRPNFAALAPGITGASWSAEYPACLDCFDMPRQRAMPRRKTGGSRGRAALADRLREAPQGSV